MVEFSVLNNREMYFLINCVGRVVLHAELSIMETFMAGLCKQKPEGGGTADQPRGTRAHLL